MKTKKYKLKDMNIIFHFDDQTFSGWIEYPNGNTRRIKTNEILTIFIFIKQNNILPIEINL